MVAGELCRLCSCLDWSVPFPSQMQQQRVTRIGLKDDMTFIGSAAAMNRSRNSIESSLADAGHRLRGCKCVVWAPGFEQFEDQEAVTEVRDLSTRRSCVNGTRSVFLVLRQTCNMACMWAWANLQNRPHKRLSGLTKPWRHC